MLLQSHSNFRRKEINIISNSNLNSILLKILTMFNGCHIIVSIFIHSNTNNLAIQIFSIYIYESDSIPFQINALHPRVRFEQH
jgi:hypothetical protein